MAHLTRQLCERIEIVPESLPDTSDVSPIQKALLSGASRSLLVKLTLQDTSRMQRRCPGQATRCVESFLAPLNLQYRVLKSGGSNAVYVHPSSCLFMTQPPIKALVRRTRKQPC